MGRVIHPCAALLDTLLSSSLKKKTQSRIDQTQQFTEKNMKTRKKTKATTTATMEPPPSSSSELKIGSESKPLSAKQSFTVHLICGLGLPAAFWVAHNLFSIDLVSDPSLSLRLIWAIECPIVILLYSFFRQNRDQCSYLKAVGRGILALPVGALVNAFGAIALGAPVGIQHIPKTINWSLMMSLFTFVPAASVYGSSWVDWQRIFGNTKANGPIDYMICLPAHGAVIGAWFGAWPMPLDWERPWQEWPICVSYGGMVGYLVCMVASFGFVLVCGRGQHVKGN